MFCIRHNKNEKVHKVRMKEKWPNIKTNTCRLTRKIKCLISRKNITCSRNKIINGTEQKFYSLNKRKQKIFRVQTSLLVFLQNKHEFKQKHAFTVKNWDSLQGASISAD